MSSAKNKILEGYGKDRKIKNCLFKHLYFEPTSPYDAVTLTKDNIKQYDVITEDKVKSASSAILRGIIGTAVLGGVGLLAGLSAKNKGIYLIAIEWKNEQRSLIEIDEDLYKVFIKNNF